MSYIKKLSLKVIFVGLCLHTAVHPESVVQSSHDLPNQEHAEVAPEATGTNWYRVAGAAAGVIVAVVLGKKLFDWHEAYQIKQKSRLIKAQGMAAYSLSKVWNSHYKSYLKLAKLWAEECGLTLTQENAEEVMQCCEQELQACVEQECIWCELKSEWHMLKSELNCYLIQKKRYEEAAEQLRRFEAMVVE